MFVIDPSYFIINVWTHLCNIFNVEQGRDGPNFMTISCYHSEFTPHFLISAHIVKR